MAKVLHEETHGFAADASVIAQYNAELDSDQWFVNTFYTLRRLYMSSTSKANPRKPEEMPQAEWGKMVNRLKKQYDRVEKMLSEMFIQAVIEHDGQKIINLANAAMFFKGKTGDDFKPVDPKRHSLLTAKHIMKLMGKSSLTIQEIVKQLNEDDVDAGSPVDGYSQIRRLCKELEIPIRPSRKIAVK